MNEERMIRKSESFRGLGFMADVVSELMEVW
jgi:hypothetical protein